MEALRGTVERLAATGQLAPEVGDALRAGFARWDAAGRPRSDPAAWLAQLGLPPLWISQLLQWRQLVEEELAATDTYDPHELSGSARLTKFLRAGPFARSSQLQGVMLGRYRVEDELARGGMGVVLRARDTVSGAVVALKVLLAGEEAEERARKRFQREAEVAARLDHPGLVRILDFGSVDQLLYLVMELIEGPFLTFRGRSPREVAALIAQVARAIGHAHAQGIVHRDLKPRNVLLRPDGSIVVTDFGLVRDLAERSSLTQSGFALGTPHYMSPEQVIGSPTGPPTDVYALGVMLYEGLAGRTPHSEHSSISLFHAIREVEPDRPGLSRPDLPRELEAICMRALAKDPARRYPHGDALASDLEAFLAGQRTVAQAALGRRRAGLALAGTAALVAAGVGGALLAGRGGGPGPAPSPSLAQGRSATPSPAATAPSASPASSPSPTPNPPTSSPPPTPGPTSMGADPTPTPSPSPSASAHSSPSEPALSATERELARAAAAARLLEVRGKKPAEQLVALDEVVQRAPFWGRGWFERAAVLAALDRLDPALADLERAVTAPEPYSGPDLVRLRGMVRYGKRDYEGSLPDLAEASAQDPHLLTNYGVALRAARRFDEAIAVFERALRAGDPSWQVCFNLAGVYQDSKRWTEALPHYREAIRREPGALFAYRNLATALTNLERWDECQALLQEALRRFGPSDHLLVEASRLERSRGNEAAARQVCERGLAREPSVLLSLELAGILERGGDHPGALATLEAGIRLAKSPQDRARLEQRLDQLKKAER